MVDQPASVNPTPTNTAPVAASPVSVAPVVATPAPAPSPAPETVAAPTTPITSEAAPTVTAEPSLIETIGKDPTVLGDAVKVEAPKVEGEVKPAPTSDIKPIPADGALKQQPEADKKESGQSDEPASLPTYEVALPEDFKADNARLGEFTKMLGEFEVKTKADHAVVEQLGQHLMERHINEVRSVVERMQQAQAEAWSRQTTEWLDAFKKDPEIGGNRQETTKQAALEFIRRHGGTPEQQTEFRDLMNKSGLGNHPAMIRMLANANIIKSEGKPLPAGKPAGPPQSKLQKMYGKKK